MKKVGIIGLGTITKNYLSGLRESKVLSLVAVCDVLENCVSKEFFRDYPFYLDYKLMINEQNLDYIIVSTPPSTHYEICMYALENNVNVIVEKPATLNINDYLNLLKFADCKNLVFEVMYHWQNGIEVIKFNELYDPSKLEEITVKVVDPYSDDGININASKVKLMGTWIDSGVNILSMIKMWTAFKKIELVDLYACKCQTTKLPIKIDVKLLIDHLKVNINIDWTLGQNEKVTSVLYDGRYIEINNSKQTIFDGKNIIKLDDMDRLQTHYYNYFKNYNEVINKEDSYLIHKVLFEVNNKI